MSKEYFLNLLEITLLCQIFVFWVRDFKFWLLAYFFIFFDYAKFHFGIVSNFWGCFFMFSFAISKHKIRVFAHSSVQTNELSNSNVRKMSILAFKCTFLGQNRLKYTIECVWERRTSMFPVLDTNLWFPCMNFSDGKTSFSMQRVQKTFLLSRKSPFIWSNFHWRLSSDHHFGFSLTSPPSPFNWLKSEFGIQEAWGENWNNILVQTIGEYYAKNRDFWSIQFSSICR